jgi:hypothetical protein
MPARLVWQLHRRQAAEVVVSAGVVAGPALEAAAGSRRLLRIRGTRLLPVRVQCPLTMAVADKAPARGWAARSGRLVRYRQRAKRQLILSIFGGVIRGQPRMSSHERRLPLAPRISPLTAPHQFRTFGL